MGVPPWRGTFHPKGVTQKRELAYLGERLDSVEINGSFYSLQRPSSYRKWAAETPDDFVFFDSLPRTTTEAAEVAKGHDHRVDPAHTTTDADRPMRYALEIRHPSYTRPEFRELLRRHDVALVIADAAGRYPLIEEVTSDFVYIRLHGHEELYVSGYTDEGLDMWAEKVRTWREHGDVFVYFDNDAKAMAPRDAIALQDRLAD